MFSKGSAGCSSPVIIIDDESESSENSPPVIIIDDDSFTEYPPPDLNSKSRDFHLDLKAKLTLSITARKRLMSLLSQGFELNEARMLLSTPVEEVRKELERACLDDSIPNAPKWPIAGVLPLSNKNDEIYLTNNETQNLGEYVDNESFYSYFENHIQDVHSSPEIAPSPILQQRSEPVLQPNFHIKAGSKRHRTAESKRGQPKEKRFKYSVNNTQRRRNFSRQFSNGVEDNFIGIELGIEPVNLPEDNLSIEQFKALRETILEKILTIKSNDIKPSFFRSHITTNALNIACCNEDTENWLKTVVNDIQQWDGVDLQVVDRTQFPRCNYVIGYFPESHGMSYKSILNFIDAQNHGFNIAEWKILTKIERNGNASFVKFSMDDNSLETLRDKEWKIHFKLKRIKLKLIGSRKMKVRQ